MNDSRLKCKRVKTISYNLPTVNLIWRRLTTKYIISIKLEMEFVFEMFLALWNNTWLSLAITEIPQWYKDRRFDLMQNKRNICYPSIYQSIIFFQLYMLLALLSVPLEDHGGSELQNDKELAKFADNLII